MRTQVYKLIAIFVLVCLLSSTIVYAQATSPRLVLNTYGPAAQTRAMVFSADSTKLYTAGLDKVIHVWDVGWNKGVGDPPRVTHIRSIRWEFTRGTRGTIWSLAANHSRNELAVGGVSLREQAGDISLVSLKSNEVFASLPTPAQRQVNYAGSGHLNNVVALDYSPDNKHLLSADIQGRIMLWAQRQDNSWVGRELRRPEKIQKYPAPVIFVDDQHYVTGQLEGTDYRLTQFDLSGRKVLSFPESYSFRIGGMAAAADGTWAAADALGQIYVTVQGDPSRRWKVRSRLPNIYSMDFAPNGILAVVCSENLAGHESQGISILEIWDCNTKQKITERQISEREKALVVAISPDGRYVATVNEDRAGIMVFPLNQHDLSLDLAESNSLGVAGFSTPIRHVNVAADGKSVVFDSDLFDAPREVDVVTGEIRKAKQQQAGNVEVLFPNWRVSLYRNELVITRDGDVKGVIPWNVESQGNVSAVVFVGNAKKELEPHSVAIASDLTNGIFLYKLSKANRSAQLVRWFYDHGGRVSSLACFPDNQRLVSGSYDGTVKIWKLAGAMSDDVQFPYSGLWGAAFVVEGNRAMVRRVDEDGIAHARGLRDGVEILKVSGYHPLESDRVVAADASTQSAQAIVNVFRIIDPLKQVKMTVSDGNQQKDFIVRPGWEPIVTIYADSREHWAIWHPLGYFNASVAEGGELFGWQFNRGQDLPPLIVSGDQLQKDFERPDVIRSLLNGQGIEQALARNVNNNLSLGSVANSIPQVKITEPHGIFGTAAGEVRIVARVRYQGGEQQQFKVTAAVDGLRLGEGQVINSTANEVFYAWNARLTNEMNQIEVIATERRGAISSLYAKDVAYVRGTSPAAKAKYNLHLLTLASEKYSGDITNTGSGFSPLQYSEDDVQGVTDSLSKSSESGMAHFTLIPPISLSNDEITRSAVEQKVNEVNRRISSNNPLERDVLIVYLSGHGKFVDGEYYYVTTSTRNATDSEIKSKGIPWSLLSQAGAQQCQVVYMIDTCQSGSVVERDVKSSVRDPKRSQGIVIAAASGVSAAIELAELQHGVFTFTVLYGLEGTADGVTLGSTTAAKKDNAVDVAELLTFVQKETQNLSAGEQKPVATPSRLIETIDLPLIDYAN